MSYLDRYVSHHVERGVFILRREFQLAAIACLYIAVKTEGTHRLFVRKVPPLTVSRLVELGRGVFSSETIIKMERKILAVLDWRMNPPTSQ
eukprot:6885513-Ditylum_brightwellii.AAC.1